MEVANYNNVLKEFFAHQISAPAQAGQPLEQVLANFAATLGDFAASGITLAVNFLNEHIEANSRAMAERYAQMPANLFSIEEHDNLIRFTTTIFISWLYSVQNAEIPAFLEAAANNFARTLILGGNACAAERVFMLICFFLLLFNR